MALNFLGHEAVRIMRRHEMLEDSRLGPKLMTLPESQISMHTLIRPYESQGRFKKQKNKKTKNKNKKTIKKTKKDATGGLLSMPALKASLRHST